MNNYSILKACLQSYSWWKACPLPALGFTNTMWFLIQGLQLEFTITGRSAASLKKCSLVSSTTATQRHPPPSPSSHSSKTQRQFHTTTSFLSAILPITPPSFLIHTNTSISMLIEVRGMGIGGKRGGKQTQKANMGMTQTCLSMRAGPTWHKSRAAKSPYLGLRQVTSGSSCKYSSRFKWLRSLSHPGILWCF